MMSEWWPTEPSPARNQACEAIVSLRIGRSFN